MGPSAIRITSLGEDIERLGYSITDRGDIVSPIHETKRSGDSAKKYIREIASTCKKVHQSVLKSLCAHALPIVLGGDHSIAVGSVAATSEFARSKRKPLGLIWIDAHADMNTPETSPSGNVHGMPLSAILGREPSELSQVGHALVKIKPAKTVLIGIRNLDSRERQMVLASGVHVFTMKDIDREGITTITEKALDIAGTGTAGFHVSFDLDVCDPSFAPGVGTPVKGGLSYREAHLLMEMMADSDRLLALDMVELNPILDTQNTTAIFASELILSAIGKKIL
jgi:arginase